MARDMAGETGQVKVELPEFLVVETDKQLNTDASCPVHGEKANRALAALTGDAADTETAALSGIELEFCVTCPDVAMPITAVVHACPECGHTTTTDIYAKGGGQ